MTAWDRAKARAGVITTNGGLFARYVGRRALEDKIPQTAAELAYITLLSLAPLYAVVVPLVRAFPPFRGAITAVQDFVFSNFIPAGGPVIRETLSEVATRASKLTLPGLLILVVTLLLAMATIETKINAIWRVQRKRRIIARLLVYWAVLSVGPVLVGLGLGVTSYLASLPLLAHEVSGHTTLGTLLLRALPFVATFLAFGLVYVIVPNRRVPLGSAIAGAGIAALVFELAKRGFTFYLAQFASYESLYGALAALPVFLIWIFLSWVVTLVGAELSYCFATWHPEIALSEKRETELRRTLVLFSRLRDLQRDGRALCPEAWSRHERGMPWETMQELVERLEVAGFVHHTDEGDLALARPLAEVSLADLQRALQCPLPEAPVGPSASPLDRTIRKAQRSLDQALDVPVETLLARDASERATLVGSRNRKSQAAR
jgi:membrane protein